MTGSDKEIRALREALHASQETVQQLAYAVSHDLQEPLRMVASYVKLLERRYAGQLDDDADEFIGFAVDGAERMQKMIEDLLVFSRLTTRGGALVRMRADEALDQALSRLGRQIESTQAQVSREPLPEVTADAEQLAQVFQQLVANALEHAGASPIVRIGATTQGTERVLFVTDDGPGIPEDDRIRVFAMFQSLRARDERSGTGAGLAIARRIVERHGGRMWVESEPGAGASFRFTLAGDGVALE